MSTTVLNAAAGVLSSTEAGRELPMPPILYGIIALGLLLGGLALTWAFRGIAQKWAHEGDANAHPFHETHPGAHHKH